MNVAEYLQSGREEIINNALSKLSETPLRHYSLSREDQNRKRLEDLFDLALRCVSLNSLLPMINYSECIAKERYNNGFDFHEVNAAYNVLEESSWKKLIQGFSCSEELPEALRIISTVLGAGKEALAGTYIKISGRNRKAEYDLMGLFGRN